jgi:predicted nucleic acid-binding protein
MKADIVILDEREGRAFAMRAGLSVTGVLGVLLKARSQGEIPRIAPQINALRKAARFFIASSLEAKVLASAGE